MDRLDNVVFTPERIEWLKRARLAAIVIFTGFFAMFILFAPEVDPADANPPAMSASR